MSLELRIGSWIQMDQRKTQLFLGPHQRANCDALEVMVVLPTKQCKQVSHFKTSQNGCLQQNTMMLLLVTNPGEIMQNWMYVYYIIYTSRMSTPVKIITWDRNFNALRSGLPSNYPRPFSKNPPAWNLCMLTKTFALLGR